VTKFADAIKQGLEEALERELPLGKPNGFQEA